MATYYLCPLSTILQAFTNLGVPLAGGKIYTYLANSSTPTNTWTDQSGSTPNSNPITLDSAGRLPNVMIWQQSRVPIKVIFKDVAGVQIGPTFDQISGVGDPGAALTTFWGGTDTGAANAYVVTVPLANFSSYVDGLIIYFRAVHKNTGASTINVNNLGVVNIVNADGSALLANQIITNSMVEVISSGGNFILLYASPIAPAVTTGSAVLTALGMTTSPTGTAYWISANGIFMLTLPGISGTSNATTFSLTGLPTNIQLPLNGITQNTGLIPATDNGARVTDVQAQFAANSGTILLLKGGSGAGWTNSGTKAVIANTILTWWYDPHGIL